ncbi:MAG: hypothetical protein KDD34_04865, partial [Bdellovibrionales bacterium]|nr:hypothetical protein [Bdellovibrionales bacterium]
MKMDLKMSTAPATKSLQDQIQHLKYICLIGPLTNVLPRHLSNPTLFVDGGVRWRQHAPHIRSLSLGDGDSSSPELMDILLPENKSISDLGYALSAISGQALDSINLSGFVGERIDHQLAVFGEVHEFLRKNHTFISFDEGHTGFAFARKQPQTFCFEGGFSMFSMRPALVTLKGHIEYCLEQPQEILPFSSLGLS